MIAFKIVMSLYLGAQILYVVRTMAAAIRERFLISTIAFGIAALIQSALLLWVWLL